MIDTWKKRREDEEEYIPGAFGAARMGAQALAERQSRPATPAVSYTAPKTTQQRYADIDSRIADYTYQKFVESDDYASLVKRYSKQGLRAMDDTLGRVAARTGGIASSYATTAGQQAYGGYMSELEDIARDMYERDKAEMMDERERLYDMQRQERSDALDLYKLRVAADEDKYNRDRAEEQEDYDRKTAMAKILAGYGDFSLYEELGLNKDQVGNMKAAYDKAQQGETVETKPKLNAAQAAEAIADGIATDEVISAYEYYYGAGAYDKSPYNPKNKTPDDLTEDEDENGTPTGAKAQTEEQKQKEAEIKGVQNSLYYNIPGKRVWDAVTDAIENPRPASTGNTLGWGDGPNGIKTPVNTLEDYKTTVDEILKIGGIDAVREAFAKKTSELTDEEWEELWLYIDNLM